MKSVIDEDGNEYMVSFKKGARNFSKINRLKLNVGCLTQILNLEL